MSTAAPELTYAEHVAIFKQATRALVHHYGDTFAAGLTDAELATALARTLGIFGGSGGPHQLSVTYQGAGLKIWGGRQVVNHVTTEPLFAGARTVAMAREVYGINDPSQAQMQLL